MEDLTIGQRIALKRKELGLSQIELGERMGVSRQSVSKWEADAAIPEIDKLIALSKLYSVSVGWLLGVEKEKAETPEQTFTDREWEIIDRLTQEKPRLPGWLLPLVAGVTAVSLCAALLSGAALYQSRRQRAELAAISQSVANLATDLGVGLPEEKLLADYGFAAQPIPGMEECTFLFQGIPAVYEPKANAELIVTLEEETVIRQECQWDGTLYTTEFTVPVRDGYAASFRLTDGDGDVHTSRVYDQLLYHLPDRLRPGDISVKWDRYTYLDGTLAFENMRFHIEAPEIFRDTPDLWTKCDLVVMGDGNELGRLDLLNRSAYSESVNFATHEVDFFTREQSIEIGSLADVEELELLLVCELTGGLQMQKSIRTINCTNWN